MTYGYSSPSIYCRTDVTPLLWKENGYFSLVPLKAVLSKMRTIIHWGTLPKNRLSCCHTVVVLLKVNVRISSLTTGYLTTILCSLR